MMSFARVLAAMPDLLARALAEHVPDDHGRCRECRADDGTSAPWPCAMRLLADEARGMTGAMTGGRPAAGRPTWPGDPATAAVPTQIPVTQVHAPVTAPAPVVRDGLDTAPQPPVSETWDPLADRRAFRRDRYHH